jgi:hypothetical protein
MIIEKGTHSSLRTPSMLWRPQRIRYDVTFTESCRYQLPPVEQSDINKLFGIGYLPHHHDNSVRFGWRYLDKVDMIEVLAYWYNDGERGWWHLCAVEIGKQWRYDLMVGQSNHSMHVVGKSVPYIVQVQPRRVGYLLQPYFGGNMTAPHDMEIKMQRV